MYHLKNSVSWNRSNPYPFSILTEEPKKIHLMTRLLVKTLNQNNTLFVISNIARDAIYLKCADFRESKSENYQKFGWGELILVKALDFFFFCYWKFSRGRFLYSDSGKVFFLERWTQIPGYLIQNPGPRIGLNPDLLNR